MENKYKNNIPGPETISSFELDNGTTVLSFSNFNSASINMIGILSGGGNLDPADKTGLAHFTASLLSRGTNDLPFADFHNQLESAGANLVFSCGSQHAWFRGKALSEDADLLFRLASDSLQNPSFGNEYVERLRNQLIAGLTIRDQDTSEVASMLQDKYLFPGHPFGLPIDGYIETIKSINRSDIQQFHQKHYGPSDMIIVVVGAINKQEIRSLAEKYFSSWKTIVSQKGNDSLIPSPPTNIIRKHKYLEGKSQVDLLMGCLGPTRTSPDFLPIYLGNNILGQFGMMGRIGKIVRSKSGLAYYATSSISAWSNLGSWEFSAGVNPENLKKTIGLIRKEIKTFVKSPVTSDELENSKSHLIGRMPMSMESNAGLANAILTMQRFGLDFNYYQKYAESIEKITADQILSASQKYLHPDHLVITSAGPGEDIN
ncbi:MAG: pitrilysin family protein [Pelolinea sp.]|nr:pitrilysin family protein [Pelolinea sp.]